MFTCRVKSKFLSFFGTRLALKGVDIKTIMELMGHRTMNMALRYCHSSQGHKKEAVDLLDISKGVTNWERNEQKIHYEKV